MKGILILTLLLTVSCASKSKKEKDENKDSKRNPSSHIENKEGLSRF